MSQLISARIPESTAERLKRYAQRKKRSLNEIAGLVLEEWLRQDEFPHIEFRDTPDGTRLACMKNSRLPVYRVVLISRERGFDVERVREFWPERSAEWVRAALHYYEAFPAEIDAEIEAEAARAQPDALKRKFPAIEFVTVEPKTSDA